MIAGLIVVIQPSGRVEHFEILGYLLAFTTVVSVYLMYVISRRYEKN
jgi:hypothetical protein